MLIIIYLFILGLFIGSFLNVLADRLPQEKSILGRSCCDYCHRNLCWYDLIPVVSFLLLHGRCRRCKKPVSLFYPTIELTTGLAFAFIGLYFLYQDTGLAYILVPNVEPTKWYKLIALSGIISVLIVIFFADIKYQVIPDSMQLSLAFFILIFHQINTTSLSELGSYLLAAIYTATPIFILYSITRGKGIGFGDVKLAANIGFFLGAVPGLIAIYFSFIAGGAVGLALLILKKVKLKSQIAFGPFLVVAMLVVFFAKYQVLNLFKSLGLLP